MPNSNLLTHHCYFSRKKPLVKSTALGSLLYYICLHGLFLFAFIFRSINPKTQKYLVEFYLLLSIYYKLYSIYLPISDVVTRKGLTTPSIRRVASICYLCASFSYWFDNLGLITEGNTYLSYAASSLPF